MSAGGARYDVGEVEQLARRGRITTTIRVAQWLSNHGYDVKETVIEVLSALPQCGRFTGSCTLVNGETADEYIVRLPDDDWYLKFWVDSEELIVDVWSCCWDGVVH